MPQEDRMRSLSHINRLLRAAESPESAITRLLETTHTLDVLEVGFGCGRALMELAWRFRERRVVFHGVDLNRHIPDREALRGVAARFGIIPKTDLAAFELPHVHFYDATTLHFGDETLDFIYSAVTIRFIRRKAEFLEEVGRVLRPGGYAMLHISESHWNYPYGLVAADRILTPFTNRFVLKYGRELIPLPTYLKLIESERFRFHFTTTSRCILLISKLASGTLSLHLDYDEALSMSGRKLPLRNHEGEIRGGFRSVYNVRPEYYQQLFDRGLLAKPPQAAA
jgi:ubiquinone/menaquinone biosynthesis C-methylase UbiE